MPIQFSYFIQNNNKNIINPFADPRSFQSSMFISSLFNSIQKKTNSKKSRSSSKDSNSSKDNFNSQRNVYEEVKLNKSHFGKNACANPPDKDLTEDFVIVDYKELEPYTKEEWEAILAKSDIVDVNDQRLYVSMHKGIPKKLRRRIWLHLANVDKLKADNAKKGVTYEWLKDQDCRDIHLIRKDITRTFPDNEFYHQKTEERLKHLENILRAYAVFDPEVGYTQGMNFLVGMLIYYMYLETSEKDFANDSDFESDIFWIIVHILQSKDWRSLYTDDTPKLVDLLAKLENRISLELPKLYEVFQAHLLIPACFSQCFITLLFYNSPLRFSKRVLDMFLLVGEDIILELVMKMLTLCENDILEKTEVEELYPFLRSQLTQYTFEKYEKEFSNLVTEQNVIRIIEYD